ASQFDTLLSDVAHRAGRLDEAIDHAGRAVAASPGVGWYSYHLGCLLAEKGDLDEAEKQLRISLGDQPRDAARRYALSDVLRRQGRLEEALAEAREATTGERAEPWYMHHYGVLLLERGSYAEA